MVNFDTNNHIWDDWGLFNPPGAIPPSDEDTYNYDDFNIADFFDDDEE